MRVSSEIRPSFSGTLKSTRTKTRFPLRSRSRIDSFAMAIAAADRAELQALFDELSQEIDAAVRIAPLVVVPREDLHEIAVHHLGVRHVDDRGVRVALEIDRHQLFFRAVEQSLERTVGGRPERGIHF